MICLRSSVMSSGITMVTGCPICRANQANAMPVLPLVASTIPWPGASSPRRRLSSRMYLPMRSLMLPQGLAHSSLARIPSTSTSGVSPTWVRTFSMGA